MIPFCDTLLSLSSDYPGFGGEMNVGFDVCLLINILGPVANCLSLSM
jgi:hypothetical protein